MFKKLVVGALAAGIALTGGIGVASASTESTKLGGSCITTGITDLGYGLYSKEVYNHGYIFPETFKEDGIKWYLKKVSKANESCGGYYGYYEGRKY